MNVSKLTFTHDEFVITISPAYLKTENAFYQGIKKVTMFRCKQFVVHQSGCAMKVNTDSLILGSWVNAGHCDACLDVGTGTGILALMLAQKTADSTCIHALDIDGNAVHQATQNALNSIWANKITVIHTALSHFNAPVEYGLIVSNPPYFEEVRTATNAYKLQSNSRQVARQTVSLSPQILFEFAMSHLAADGQLYCLYPFSREAEIQSLALAAGLKVKRILRIRHNTKRAPYVSAFCFVKTSGQAAIEELIIRDDAGQYTKAFKQLCGDFYLNF